MADNTNIQYTISLKDMLTPGLQNADKEANKLESSLSSLAAVAGSAFAALGLKEVIGDIINVGAELEKTKIGLTTLLGDAGAAQQVIVNTMQDAQTTPFNFEQLLKANQLLISTGLNADRARGDVLNLANAVAATGGGNDELTRMAQNMQQIKNAGVATAADIKQFAFAGINVYGILAKALGTTTENVKGMKISYEQLTYALQVAHDKGGQYAGGLEAMAGSTAVQISNLGDGLYQVKVALFDNLKPAVDWFIGAMGTIITFIKEHPEIALATGIGILTAAVIGLVAATWSWTIALLANPITWIVLAIGALVGAVVYAWRNFGVFRAVIYGIWAFLKEFVSFIKNSVIEVFKGLGDIILGALTFDVGKMQEGFVRAGSALYEGGKKLGVAFKKGYDEGMADFQKDVAEKKNPLTATAPNTTGGVPKPSAVAGAEGKTGRAAGQKILNITINIGKLIDNFTVKTTNIQEAAGKVKDMVQQALLSAVNDSQVVPER